MIEGVTLPYCGPAPVPVDILLRWNLDPLLPLGFISALVLWWRFGDRTRSRYFHAALAVLFVALVSPVCALTTALFSARSAHHLLIAAGAAPLIALALPRGKGASGSPWPALAASSGVLWLWHWPAVYEASFASHAVYWALQLGLIGSFAWFWRCVLAPEAAPVSALGAIAIGAGQMGLLGAVLTFAPRPLYEVHGAAPLAWGLTPLADQQLGGLLMWVPAFFVYGAFALATARRTAREMGA